MVQNRKLIKGFEALNMQISRTNATLTSLASLEAEATGKTATGSLGQIGSRETQYFVIFRNESENWVSRVKIGSHCILLIEVVAYTSNFFKSHKLS